MAVGRSQSCPESKSSGVGVVRAPSQLGSVSVGTGYSLFKDVVQSNIFVDKLQMPVYEMHAQSKRRKTTKRNEMLAQH